LFRGSSLELGDELITGAAKTLGLYLHGITTKVLILLFSRFMKNFVVYFHEKIIHPPPLFILGVFLELGKGRDFKGKINVRGKVLKKGRHLYT